MPELPEVETVKNTLSAQIIGRRVEAVEVFYAKMVKTPAVGLSELMDRTFESIARKGKFLIFGLSGALTMVLHLRMEGKFFVVEERPDPLPRSLSFLLRLDDGRYLAFFDTRKFGVVYLFKNRSDLAVEPLLSVGPDPFECSAEHLYESYRRQRRYLKEVLLDQSLVSGIGNIYADEILFAAGLSPFKPADSITPAEAERLLEHAVRIMKKSIETGGSTVRSYLSSPDHAGSFQEHLMVYGRAGQPCKVCGTLIEKRQLDGRGTSFCRRCQHQGLVVGITGAIASGKSTVAGIFARRGFELYSCDQRVHELYADPRFLKEAAKLFPEAFADGYDRDRLLEKLSSETKFRRRYETYLYRALRLDVIEYLNRRADRDVAIEAPRLFEARFEDFCSYLVGVTADEASVRERLKARGTADIKKMLELNSNSRLHQRLDELDFIIENSGTLEELEEKTLDIIRKIRAE